MFTLGELNRQIVIIDNNNVEGGSSFNRTSHLTYDGVGSPTPQQVSIADASYLQKWSSSALSNFEPSITVSGSNTKVIIDMQHHLLQVTSTTDEVPFRIERKINSGAWVGGDIFWLPDAVARGFSPNRLLYVDVHGASAGDTIYYRFKNDGVSLGYSANLVHQWLGVVGSATYYGFAVLTEN